MKKNNQTLLHINTGSLLYTSFRSTGKFKYYLIVGMSSFEYAMVCLYPKEELNIDVEFVRNLKDYFLPVSLAEFPEQEFIADCSRIIVKRFGSVAAWLNRKGNVGTQKISENYLSEIIKKVFDAITIPLHDKKEYNLSIY